MFRGPPLHVIIENLNFYFRLKPAFYLDHTFPRREELGHGKDVSYPPYFLVSMIYALSRGEEKVGLKRKNNPPLLNKKITFGLAYFTATVKVQKF